MLIVQTTVFDAHYYSDGNSQHHLMKEYLWHVANISSRDVMADRSGRLAQDLDGATLQVEATKNASEESSLTTTT